MKQKNGYLTLSTALVLCICGLAFLHFTGFFQAASSMEGVQNYVERFTPYSHLVFFVVQLLSVILAPIPSNISAAAGGMLFGTWMSFVLTITAVLSGSMLVFLLARKLGKPFADRVVSQRVSQGYMDVIRSKQNTFLVLAFLFPFFPDDMICALAGLTDMPTTRFFIIALLTRPWGLLFASALGGAVLDVPLGWMVVMGLLGAAIFLAGMKYGSRAEKWAMKKLKKG